MRIIECAREEARPVKFTCAICREEHDPALEPACAAERLRLKREHAMKPYIIKRKLLTCYLNASKANRRDGAAWYAAARREARKLAKDSGRTLSVAAGVIAALSPRAHWKTNLQWANYSCATGCAKGGLTTCVAKAQRILDGERPLTVLSGPKVRAFYRAIMGDSGASVVDVWIAYAVGVDSNGWSEKQYNIVAKALTDAAKSVGKPTAIFQAIVWIAVRGKHD